MQRTALAIAITLATIGQAQAGGLWLNEFGDFAGGRASAGAAAGTDDAATIIHNPASITRLEGSHLHVNAGVLIPQVEFQVDESNPIVGNGDGGQAGLNAPVAGTFYVHDFDSERWSGGIYMAGLAGAGLEYDDDWVGRYQNTEVELLLLGITPTVAYQVTDKLSLGLGIQLLYATLDLELRVPTPNPMQDDGRAIVDGDDTDVGFALGALYEISDSTRLGINYQSELDPSFGGDLKLEPPGIGAKSDLELPFAQKVRIGLHHDLNPEIGLDFTVGWDDWSTLDHVLISTSDREVGLPRNWDDTYHVAAGLQYHPSENWSATFGISYDTDPSDAEDRTADLPVDRQVRYALGLQHNRSDSFNIGGYLSFMDLGKAKISSGRGWSGDYRNNSIIAISINANWVF